MNVCCDHIRLPYNTPNTDLSHRFQLIVNAFGLDQNTVSQCLAVFQSVGHTFSIRNQLFQWHLVQCNVEYSKCIMYSIASADNNRWIFCLVLADTKPQLKQLSRPSMGITRIVVKIVSTRHSFIWWTIHSAQSIANTQTWKCNITRTMLPISTYAVQIAWHKWQ